MKRFGRIVKRKTPAQKRAVREKRARRRKFVKRILLDFGVYLVCVGGVCFRIVTPDLSDGIAGIEIILPRWEAIAIGAGAALAALFKAELEGDAPGRRASFRRRAKFAFIVGIAALASLERMLGGM